MKTEAKNIKVGDIFTENGLTVKVTNITNDDYKNGAENYTIETVSISYNKKIYPSMKIGLVCIYRKKAKTIVNIK